LTADSSDLLHVAGAGDAEHDSAEDHRADEHPYQCDEAVPKGFQFHCRRGIYKPQHSTADDGEKNPEVEMSNEALQSLIRQPIGSQLRRVSQTADRDND